MNSFTPAKQRLNGSFGYLQINGIDWGEVTGVQISIELEYADVKRGLDNDKKLVGRSGSGTLTVSKAYSRSADIVDAVQAGRQPTARLVAWLADPDAVGGQEERVAIDSINFTTVEIMNFTHGALNETQYPFTFAPGDLKYLDRINPA